MKLWVDSYTQRSDDLTIWSRKMLLSQMLVAQWAVSSTCSPSVLIPHWGLSTPLRSVRPIPVKLQKCVSVNGGSRVLWFFMSQHRKNSARGKVIAKKWFIRIRCLWRLQAGGGEGAPLWELSGLQFYNQRKSGEGEKTPFFFILE